MQGQRFRRFRVTTYNRSDQPSSLLLLSRQLKVSSTLSLIFGARLKSRTRKAIYKVDITAKGRPFDQLQGRQTIDHTSKGSPVRAFFLLQGLRRARRPLKAVETSLLSCPRHCSQQVRAFALPLHLVHLNLNEGLQLPLEVPACAP